ncbi:MAG: NADH-quinone oxidoreductase subunit M [Chloroflexi bacterium]|nr:NADH-quinone oxidoreductase subunit M [Chloroflexota bacterium]
MGSFISNVLNFLILWPAIGAIVVALLPSNQPNLARWTALGMSIPTLIISIGLFYGVMHGQATTSGYHLEYVHEWFPEIGANWHVGVDGISVTMVLLTALLTPLALLIAFEHTEGTKAILALILFLQMGMIGVFVALDMVIFFIFWEIGLVPMYFIINQWGGANRKYASMKFFIYTMAGSLGLLLAIQLIGFTVGDAKHLDGPTFDIQTWQQVWPEIGRDATYKLTGEKDTNEILGMSYNAVKYYAFLGFFIAFAIKIPIWPFHTWLPDAHTEAPTAGSMLLAGVLLKLGAYGFIRLVIPLFPEEIASPRTLLITDVHFTFAQVMAALGMLGIVLGAFSAWAQDDLKKLVAYSSVNHMGFVVMGIAVMGVWYSVLWAQSPDVDDPVLALQMAGQPLEDADIGHYPDKFQSDKTTIDALSSSEQKQLAQAKLDVDLDMDENMQSANVALNGAVLQMFNHGLSAAAMFLLVGALYHKAHTRDLRRFGGLWHIVPVFGGLFVFTSMASLGLPGLNGFTSEWMIISGSFPYFEVMVLISTIGVLMTGAYILKGIQKVLQGPPNPDWIEYHEHHHSLEIARRETIAIAPLVALMLITGLYPNWILPVINERVYHIFSAFIR